MRINGIGAVPKIFDDILKMDHHDVDDDFLNDMN